MTDAIAAPLILSGDHESAARRFARPVLAVFCGALAGLLTTSSLWRGVASGYPAENPEDTWGILVWGDHYVWRSLVSLASGSVAAMIASAIGRRRTGLLAVLAVSPAAMLWLVLAVWRWIPQISRIHLERATLGYRISGGVLAVLLIWFAFAIGEAVGPVAASNAAHFDARRHTLLGIRWYHYLWLCVPIHIILSQSAWVLVRFSSVIKAASLTGALIPGLFMTLVIASLQLTLIGGERAYLLLAGFTTSEHYVKQVIKYTIGYPLLAIIIQSTLSFAYWGLAKLVEHLFG